MENDELWLHDSQLRTLSLDWKRGSARLEISAWNNVLIQISARGVASLNTPRQEPWGHSDFILSAYFADTDGPPSLTIEMQSGDVIQLVASEIDVVCTRHSDQPLTPDPRNLPLGTHEAQRAQASTSQGFS